MRLFPHRGLHRLARGLAALLLALQASAGGAVAIAHAADSIGGPPALESHHSAQCVALHDAARCAQCQYQATRTLPVEKQRAPLPAGAHRRLSSSERACRAPARPRHRAAQPRAPPAPLS